MKLERFIKNKKQKEIVIGSIVGILLLIGGITLYRTFALYKVEKTFDVLEGTVPNFSNGDIQIAITVDGRKEENIPKENNNYGVVVSCDNAIGSWDYENWNAVLGDFNGSKIKCNLYFESTFSGYIKALSNVEESIVKEEHEATDQTPDLADYRYVGATPNNYVCLEESEKCTDDNLYRIIGVIPTQKEENGPYEDRVKLIKNTSYEERVLWGNENDSLNGEWSQMKLNTETLNKTYWQSISSYHNYIENAKWYIGQNRVVANTPLQFYKNERANKMEDNNNYATTIITNIGLFNGSDYFFATSGGEITERKQCLQLKSADWNNTLYTKCKDNTWLYDNQKKYWTINLGSKDSDTYNAMSLYETGEVGNCGINGCKAFLKPTFYLKSNIQYKNGDGTQSNPYRISIN